MSITPEQIKQVLGNASVTFAQIVYTTQVKTAAAHKEQNIQKITTANVILSSTLKAHTSVYANRVKKTASTIETNDQASVEAFVPQENYFQHTDCYSIVQHREQLDKFYLYAIFNKATSVYMHNGNIVSEQSIAEFLTASAKKELLNKDNVVHNKTHNIKHTVTVRTIALSNITSIRARKQILLK